MRGTLLIIFILFAILAPASSQVRVIGADYTQNASLTQFAIPTEDLLVDSIFTFNENGLANISLQGGKIPTTAQPRSNLFTFNEASASSRSLEKARVPTGILTRSSLFMLHETTRDQRDLVYPLEMLNDLSAPVISNITAERLSTGEARINWTTDEFATSLLRYGIAPGDFGQEAIDNLYQKNHSLVLKGLSDRTKYFFALSGTDRSGNEAESVPSDFTA